MSLAPIAKRRADWPHRVRRRETFSVRDWEEGGVMRRFAFLSVMLIAAMLALPRAANAQWGDVEMTFLYDGKPPEPGKVADSRDGLKIRDETWLVAKDGGIKNVVVRLLLEKDVKLPIHPDFEKAKGTNVRVDLLGGYFEPRVTIKYTNQDLTFTNLDPFAYAI